MSIEIKQLLIKSNIIQRTQSEGTDDSSEGQDIVKEELLAECRRLVLDIMREKEER